MAMMLRSSCPFTRKPPPTPPSGCFSVKSLLPALPEMGKQNSAQQEEQGKVAFPFDRAEKFASALSDASNGSSEIHRLLLAGKGKLMSRHYHAVLKQLSAHQGKLNFRFPAKVLLTYNALMLVAPFQALAETCEAQDSFFNRPLLLLIALIGATVGGLVARQRKGELQKVNEQLRQINAALRRQAKIESYAPALSYAPVGSRSLENEVIVDPRREELIARLKAGKSFLRNQEPEKAFTEFKAGLELAQALKDHVEEKKAVRGLGASLQRQGKYREAIKYFNMVLKISTREGENSGNTEAYGAIADCYTELGDLERAGKFYDQYISRLESD